MEVPVSRYGRQEYTTHYGCRGLVRFGLLVSLTMGRLRSEQRGIYKTSTPPTFYVFSILIHPSPPRLNTDMFTQ